MSNTFTEGEAFAPQRSLFNALGFTKEEIDTMTKHNPAKMLGIG